MSEAPLRLVEKGGMDKHKALEAALSQIERAFGKGSVMKLGRSRDVHFLPKPFSLAQLAGTVKDVLVARGG